MAPGDVLASKLLKQAFTFSAAVEITNTRNETLPFASVMIQSGLDITPAITHRLPYTEFEKGFAAMLSGDCGKVILDWTVAR